MQRMKLDRRTFIASAGTASVVRSASAANPVNRYTPFSAGIVHFFGYGQSLSAGYFGVPVVSGTQPYDNLMIGNATRPLNNRSETPVSTDWTPTGSADSNGTYPFNPMIATAAMHAGSSLTAGETPSEGAVNRLRRTWLMQRGLTADPGCRFVVTNCGIGGKNIAELSNGADPDIFNRLIQAAAQVRAAATALGLTYQVGGVIYSQGEADVAQRTSYASYLASLQQLQQSFLDEVVVGIAGQPTGTVVPWFVYQPDSKNAGPTINVAQALLDWSITPNSDCYLAGPVYQYPDHSIHLTANGYRWHGEQVGKAMVKVLLGGVQPRPLYMLGASLVGGYRRDCPECAKTSNSIG